MEQNEIQESELQVDDGAELGAELQESPEKPLRPSQCRGRMRKALSEEYEAIIQGFVAEAKRGSAAHVRLANELLEPVARPKSRKKGSIQKLLENWDKL